MSEFLQPSFGKKNFPIFHHKSSLENPYIYLDSAATTHKPECVIEAVRRFYSESYGTVYRGIYQDSSVVTAAYSGVREKVKEFIHAASAKEVVFTGGCTSGLNQLAIAFNDSELSRKGPVAVTEVEHHANVLSWEIAARRVGNSVVKVRVDEEGRICLEHLESLLRQGVSLVSLAHISNVSGVIQPLKEVVSLVRHYGSILCLDAAQSISHQPIDVQKLDIDFMVFSGHKMYGPTGIGILYGKESLLESLPPAFGGGDMVDVYDAEKPRFQSSPLKFEAGTPPIAEVIGLGEAIEYLETLGLENIFSRESSSIQGVLEELEGMSGVTIIGPRRGVPRGALISLTMDNVHPMDMGALLDSRGIAVRTGHLCAQPAMNKWKVPQMLRVSLGVYNDDEDVRTFLRSFRESLGFLS
ncbi:SufS family cysteine desulfurase [Chlamydiifrater phoenicopteri]|uniref:SufS family cysteine desulfurase n=1 Tax=Chlamydiifrater phoenicopteri TaxID=2681469 RepID=UPI001BCBB202|nr:SufS family cysteine desulfurase [Chlamydiifrater phoenicopteri]